MYAGLVFILPITVFSNIFLLIAQWVKVFRIIPEFKIFRLTFHRKSASKY